MARPWEPDEIAWAQECAGAGDTPEDVAEMAGRTVADVLEHVRFPRRTNNLRTALQLYVAGTDVRSIGRAIKPDTPRPDSLGACYVKRLRAKGFNLPSRVPSRSAAAEARRHG
jgi:hypothetical protein